MPDGSSVATVPAGFPGILARMTGMKVVFWTYLFVIVAGLAYFTVIGLSHH